MKSKKIKLKNVDLKIIDISKMPLIKGGHAAVDPMAGFYRNFQ
jgi:hypothetical protein